ESLRRTGVARPAAHLFVAETGTCATTLMSMRPFTESELLALRFGVADRGWRVLLDPAGPSEPELVRLVGSRTERDAFTASLAIDVSPVTDDSPFFFHVYEWRSFLSGAAPPVGEALLLL